MLHLNNHNHQGFTHSATDEEALKAYLDARADFYNRPAFIDTDPIQVPKQFTTTEDIEIAAFLTATLAWGQRCTIIGKAKQLLALMGNSPYDFLIHARGKDFSVFETFCHRTFNATDALYFLHTLKRLYLFQDGLHGVFQKGFAAGTDAGNAIAHFRQVFFADEHPARTRKHVPDVLKGSSAKRLNMFLRWMVRKDNRGVDFGLWDDISPSQLCIPLDLHVGNTARRLGLLRRNQNDWKAVMELTAQLRRWDAADPVKYDFALFGISIFEQSSRGGMTGFRKYDHDR